MTTQIVEHLEKAAEASKGAEPEVKSALLQAVASAEVAAIQPPDTGTANQLWLLLVRGLVVVLVAALIGVCWAVLDQKPRTSPDVLVTIFSSVLTGLIGLFAKSPLQKGN